MLMTLGGPIYCMQLFTLARNLDASLLCTDYGRNGYEKPNQRSSRLEDWGDPAYLAAVGRQRARLARDGIKISKLVVVGVSYSGYADAELVATHPELRPDALVVVDSYLDLAARFRALPRYHPTRREMMKALGGTPDQKPAVYAARSPSHHLDGLARAIRSGMKLVVVWSVRPEERTEFRGATCSKAANAQWIARLATVLGRPVTAHVTNMRHAHALWDRGRALLALAGVGSTRSPFPGHTVVFRPRAPIPAGSFC